MGVVFDGLGKIEAQARIAGLHVDAVAVQADGHDPLYCASHARMAQRGNLLHALFSEELYACPLAAMRPARPVLRGFDPANGAEARDEADGDRFEADK